MLKAVAMFSDGPSRLPALRLIPVARWAAYLGALLLVGACDRTDPQQLAEWTPADHDNQAQPQAGQVDTSKPRPGMPDLEKQGITDVVLAAWKTNCVPCHGVIGRGDGPQGRLLKPPDLTSPQWQRVAIDSEITHTIKKGRGRMPAFGHLPDETVSGLVSLVRMLSSDKNGSSPGSATGPNSDE